MKNLYAILIILFCALSVSAQNVNIPSIYFKSALAGYVCADTDGDGVVDNDVDTNDDGEIQVSEALAVTGLDLHNTVLNNVVGINAFANLRFLVCSSGNLSMLNLSGMHDLQTIDCSTNRLYSITLSGLPQLQTLNCSGNGLLTILSITGSDNLKNINCAFGRLINFDASVFPQLETLNCSGSLLESLNVSSLGNLTTLNCSGNKLTTLNFSGLNSLQTLDCARNLFQTLDFSGLTNLQTLDCSRNHFQIFDFSPLTQLKTLECSYNALNTMTVAPLVHLEKLSCTNDGLTMLDVSGLAGLKDLNCSANNLVSLNLSSQANLENLTCFENNLVDLDCSHSPNLKSLDCSKNNLSTLNINSCIALETVDCNLNHLTDLDGSNLTNLTALNCEKNDLTSLQIANSIHLKTLNCRTNHLSMLNTSALNALETLRCDNNDLTAIDTGNMTQLKMLTCNANHIASINTANTVNLTQLECNSNELTALSILNLVNLQILKCSDNQITAMDFGNLPKLWFMDLNQNLFTTLDFSQLPGTGRYFHYYLSNNPNLTYINIKNGGSLHRRSTHDSVIFMALECDNLLYVCADEFNLGHINAPATTQVSSYCSFVPGGTYNTIRGTITLDYDNNGCDANDNPAIGNRININDSVMTGATFANNEGKYSFFTQAGEFTVTPQFENPYFIVSPASSTISFAASDGSTQVQNFCIGPNGTHNDVEVRILAAGARPGFDTTYLLVYNNKGNQILSGNLNFTFDDAVLDLISASVPPTSQALNHLDWSYANLLPFETRMISVVMNVNSPQETPPVNIGDILNFNAVIDPVSDDETMADNTFSLAQTVVGAIDPNDKTCLQGNAITPEKVGDYLDYVIRFENSGTAAAESIVVRDIIDPEKFDITSLQLTASSHPQVTRISGNKVEFIFENINLPAAIDDEPGSHGFVAFKIKTKNNLRVDDSVSNTADIYFDYNWPVTTNTASTTIALLAKDTFEDPTVSIYPNPAKNTIHITAKDKIRSIVLFDLQGRAIETSITNDKTVTFDVSNNAAGVYFVKVNTEKGVKVEKIIKE